MWCETEMSKTGVKQINAFHGFRSAGVMKGKDLQRLLAENRRDPASDYLLTSLDLRDHVTKSVPPKKKLSHFKAKKLFKAPWLKKPVEDYEETLDHDEVAQEKKKDVTPIEKQQDTPVNNQDKELLNLRCELQKSEMLCSGLKEKLHVREHKCAQLQHKLQQLKQKYSLSFNVQEIIYKALRIGYGLCAFSCKAESLLVKRQLRHGFAALQPRDVCDPSPLVSPSTRVLLEDTNDSKPSISLPSKRLILLRTEQLLLIQQSTDLINQVTLFKKAIEKKPIKCRRRLKECLVGWPAAQPIHLWRSLGKTRTFPFSLGQSHPAPFPFSLVSLFGPCNPYNRCDALDSLTLCSASRTCNT